MDNAKAWDYAIGIVQIDGIKPSDDFLELVEKEKRGEITGEDIRKVLYKKIQGNREKITMYDLYLCKKIGCGNEVKGGVSRGVEIFGV